MKERKRNMTNVNHSAGEKHGVVRGAWCAVRGAWCVVRDPQQSRRSRFLPRRDFLCVSWRIVSYSSMAIRDSLCRNWEGAPEKGSLKTEPAGRKRILTTPLSTDTTSDAGLHPRPQNTTESLRTHLELSRKAVPISSTTKIWETFEYMAQERLPLTLGQITLF